MEDADEPRIRSVIGSQKVPPSNGEGDTSITPQTDSDQNPSDLLWVFAIGRVEPRFPSLALEKEFAQVVGRTDTGGLTNRQVLQSTLSERTNRYLVRQMCWVFAIEGLETYLLLPRDPADFDLLRDTVRADPTPTDLDVVIGRRGPIAEPEMCGGLMLPVVWFDVLYSFDRELLLSSLPRPDSVPEAEEEQFRAMAAELFDRISQIADNAGATDEHRALNYLAVRYPSIYTRTAEAYRGNSSLTGVEVRPSRLSGVRKVLDVIFSYTHRQTDVTEKYFVRVDVTEEFPFLVTRLAPFYER
jgi:hypothetical protein